MNIQLPTNLPDGTTLYVDADFYDRLHNGEPSVGWIGDERLGVYFAENCLEIRRLCEDGELRLVAKSKPGVRQLNVQMFRWLAERDSRSRRAYDVKVDIDKHNAKIERERETALNERVAEAAERMYHAANKDAGHAL